MDALGPLGAEFGAAEQAVIWAGGKTITGVSKVLTVAEDGAVYLGNGVKAELDLAKNSYSGSVYEPNFVGPVKWEYLYRGDSSPRSDFLSAMSQRDGIEATESFLNTLTTSTQSELLAEHGVSSALSPFVSTSKNPKVAEYFSRGPNQEQSGFLTTFRIEEREIKHLQDQEKVIPNFENPMSFFESNPSIGLPESEFLFRNSIDPKYIYKQVPTK